MDCRSKDGVRGGFWIQKKGRVLDGSSLTDRKEKWDD